MIECVKCKNLIADTDLQVLAYKNGQRSAWMQKEGFQISGREGYLHRECVGDSSGLPPEGQAAVMASEYPKVLDQVQENTEAILALSDVLKGLDPKAYNELCQHPKGTLFRGSAGR